MRPSGPAFFICLLMMLVLATAGCSFVPFAGNGQEKPQGTTDVGFSSETMVPEVPSIRFERITDDLTRPLFDDDNATANATLDRQVLYIRGTQLDDAGNAAGWMVVVRHNNLTSLLTYDRHGDTIVPWNASTTGQAIPLDRILVPSGLFGQNRETILAGWADNSTPQMQIELTGINYTITVTGDGMVKTREFDAITGAVKGSP